MSKILNKLYIWSNLYSIHLSNADIVWWWCLIFFMSRKVFFIIHNVCNHESTSPFFDKWMNYSVCWNSYNIHYTRKICQIAMWQLTTSDYWLFLIQQGLNLTFGRNWTWSISHKEVLEVANNHVDNKRVICNHG